MNEKKKLPQRAEMPAKPQQQQQRSLSPVDAAMQGLGAMIPKLRTLLPSHVTPEKFLGVIRVALLNKPDLLNYNQQSLFNAALECAKDGLFPDGKEAAFVPFKGSVKYMPMIGGIYKKIHQSGEVKLCQAEVIHEADTFRYWMDEEGPHVLFEPKLFSEERGQAIGAFAMAKLNEGGIRVDVMSKQQIENTKNVSAAVKSGRDTPWSGPFEHEMWKKTVVRRLSKTLPTSPEIQQTLQRDDEFFNIENTGAKSKAEELRDKLKTIPPSQPTVIAMSEAEMSQSIEVEPVSVEATAEENNNWEPTSEFEKALAEIEPRNGIK